MSRSVLFVMTSHSQLGDTGRETGYFLSEVTHPHQVLVDAGLDVEFVSPSGGTPPMDPKSFNTDDGDNKAFLEHDGWRRRFASTRRPSQVDPGDYDAIFFAGGHGAMWDFPDNAELAALTRAIYERGGAVGAVCHGPAGLVNVTLSDGSYLVDGKQVASFTNEEEEAVGLSEVVPFLLQSKLEERGARHNRAEKFQAHVVSDGRLVTGQNPASARGVGEGLLRLVRQR